MLKLEGERSDEDFNLSTQRIIGTVDYAIVSRGGFSMEFVREDGAWKLLYIYFSMC